MNLCVRECVTAGMKMQFLPHLKIKSFINSSFMDFFFSPIPFVAKFLSRVVKFSLVTFFLFCFVALISAKASFN